MMVSVIIPSHNRLHLLKEALDSVLLQTYTDYEIIVVDDGKPEDLEPYIVEYKDRVIFFQIPSANTPSVPRNIGIKESKGKYIAFLDSDDLWLPDKLKTQMDIFRENSFVSLVCSNAYVFGAGSKLFLSGKNEKVGFLLNELIDDNFVITSSCIVKRDAFDACGYFLEDIFFKGVEDYELWLRIARWFDIYYSPLPFVIYRDSNTTFRSRIPLLEYYDRINVICAMLYSALLPVVNRHIDNRIYEGDINKLYCFISLRDGKQLLKLFKELLIRKPLKAPLLCCRVALRIITVVGN